MEEVNNQPPAWIEVIDGFSFWVFIDPTNFGDYLRDGQVQNVNVPKKIKINSLESVLWNPLENALNGMFYIFDLAFFERPGQLHFALQGVLKFHQINKWLPNDDPNDIEQVIKLVTDLNTSYQ